jgi:hypothetical protein
MLGFNIVNLFKINKIFLDVENYILGRFVKETLTTKLGPVR